MLTPCPQCACHDLWIVVTQKAEQKIALSGPHDGEYTYDVQHEDVQDTTYHAATCRVCDYVWRLDETSAEEGHHQGDSADAENALGTDAPEMVTCHACDMPTRKAYAGPNTAGSGWIGECCWEDYQNRLAEED
jgi:hypothetical protein